MCVLSALPFKEKFKVPSFYFVSLGTWSIFCEGSRSPMNIFRFCFEISAKEV
jgi:hypothetical protein